MDHSDLKRQAVFYLGLCELVETRLAIRAEYTSAVKALDAAWSWIEHKDVSGKTLNDLILDEEGYGIGAPMSVESDRTLWHAWGCVSDAMTFTALAAYDSEGAAAMPENVSLVNTPESRNGFADSFRALVPVESVLERFAAELDAMPDGSLVRSDVRNCAFSTLHSAAMAQALRNNVNTAV